MTGINPLVWRGVAASGALLSLIGALVAWITTARIGRSFAGIDFAEGEVVLAFAIMALVAIGWRHLVGEAQETAPWLDKAVPFLGIASTSRGSPHWAWVDRAVAVMGVAILILITVVVKWVDLSGPVGDSDGELSIGAGIYLGLVGSLILIASAVPSIVEMINATRGSADEAKTSDAAPAQGATSPGSAADEIEKLAGLLERGVITQEEFDAKKKELLGL